MAGHVGSAARRGATVLGVGVVLATPFATHLALATGRFAAVATVLACGQVAVLVGVAWRTTGWRRGMAAAAGLLIALLLAPRLAGFQPVGPAGLVANAAATHAMLYFSLLALFGQSLRPGHTPLVTMLAQRMRGTLTPAMRGYTRKVTVAWCGFAVAQLLLSATLLAFAPERVWSFVVNVLDGPMLAAMFLGEFAIRRIRFRGVGGHASPVAVARAFARGRGDG